MENYLPVSEGEELDAAEKGVVRNRGGEGGKVEKVNVSRSKSVLLTGMTQEGEGAVKGGEGGRGEGGIEREVEGAVKGGGGGEVEGAVSAEGGGEVSGRGLKEGEALEGKLGPVGW